MSHLIPTNFVASRHKLNNGVDFGTDRTKVTNAFGHVTIDARGGNDRISVSQRGRWLNVNINQRDTVSLDLWKTRSVAIKGGTGNDAIVVDPSVTARLNLQGNSGNDFIQGGRNALNIIRGGPGLDLINYGNYQSLSAGRYAWPPNMGSPIPLPYRPPWWGGPIRWIGDGCRWFHNCCIRPIYRFIRPPIQLY